MKKKFLAVVLAITCTLSLAACGGTGSEPSQGSAASESKSEAAGEDGEVSEQAAEEVKSALPDTLEDPNLVIVWDAAEEQWLADKAEHPELFNLIWTTKEAFEEKYGGEVTVLGVGWGNMQSTVTEMVNAGETVDVCQANDQNFPTFGAKGILQDISPYIDLDDDFWYDSATDAYTFGGVTYAVGADAIPVVISYNKTLFDQYNIKTPREYFDEGNWTWDTFRDVAMQMTGDTDGDGLNDTFGFGWWDCFYIQLLTTNGVTCLSFNDDGTVSSNYLTPQAEECFTFLQNGYSTDGFIEYPDGDNFMTDYRNGKLAMTAEYGFSALTSFNTGDYEIGWVPLPTGPSGEKYVCSGAINGLGIPATSKNPEGAAAFIRMAYELQQEYNDKERVAAYGEEDNELMKTLSKNMKYVPIGIEKFWDANYTLYRGFLDGTPVNTFATTADEQIREGASITLGK